MRGDPRYPTKLALSLATVYLVWGSSFLFTKIAVDNMSIAAFSSVRFLTAGTLLALTARFWGGETLSWRRSDWRHAAIAGFFMVFLSNGLNAWGILYLPTNQAALLNGTAAFWIAGLGVLGPRGQPLSRWSLVGLVIGFAGTAMVLVPTGVQATRILAQLCILVACLAFSLGTLYYRSIETTVSPLLFMGMQLWSGGLMLLAVAVFQGGSAQWHFNAHGLTALAYLTLASSCFAFTAYGWLTRNCTPAIIGTYSYVNPAIAAFLGWQFLHETLSRLQLVGMIVVIAGVAIMTLPGNGGTDPKALAEPKAPISGA